MSEYDFDIVEVGDEIRYREDDYELVCKVLGMHWSSSEVVLDVEDEFGTEYEIAILKDDIGVDDYSLDLIDW